MTLLLAGKDFNLVAAILGILLLLVLSIPLGFLIALLLRKWHAAHPVEQGEDDKHPLKLND
jgi:hypothetical protein